MFNFQNDLRLKCSKVRNLVARLIYTVLFYNIFVGAGFPKVLPMSVKGLRNMLYIFGYTIYLIHTNRYLFTV